MIPFVQYNALKIEISVEKTQYVLFNFFTIIVKSGQSQSTQFVAQARLWWYFSPHRSAKWSMQLYTLELFVSHFIQAD